METITYKGKDYPCKTLTMNSDETGEVTYTIADETLSNAMRANSPHFKGKEEKEIDEMVYYYVEAGVLELSDKEICAKHLDIPFELIEEE